MGSGVVNVVSGVSDESGGKELVTEALEADEGLSNVGRREHHLLRFPERTLPRVGAQLVQNQHLE